MLALAAFAFARSCSMTVPRAGGRLLSPVLFFRAVFLAAACFSNARALPDVAVGASRTTCLGSLSSRRPRKIGWRSMPLDVHSLNFTSATYLGSAQCDRSLVFGVVVKGDCFRSMR